MDREDRRRYFIVGSIVLEVVTPLFRNRLEHYYKKQGFSSLQGFIGSQPVGHVIFHLRHRNIWCCVDQEHCVNNSELPVTYDHWDLLYTGTPESRDHLCHCSFTANSVQLTDLDLTLAGLILLNCCPLTPEEENAINSLLQFKHDYLSYNTKGRICIEEYETLWAELETGVLDLDSSKKEDLDKIVQRQFDEHRYIRYMLHLLGIHSQLDMTDAPSQDAPRTETTQERGIDHPSQEFSYHVHRCPLHHCSKDNITEVACHDEQPQQLDGNIFQQLPEFDDYPHLELETDATESDQKEIIDALYKALLQMLYRMM